MSAVEVRLTCGSPGLIGRGAYFILRCLQVRHAAPLWSDGGWPGPCDDSPEPVASDVRNELLVEVEVEVDGRGSGGEPAWPWACEWRVPEG